MIIKYPMDKEKLKELKAGDVVEFEGQKIKVLADV